MSELGAADQADDAVGNVLREFFASVERRDLPRFLGLFTGDARLTVVENSDRYDWQGFRAFAEQFFQDVERIAFEVEPVAVSRLGSAAAVATGAFRGRGATVGGEQIDFRHAFTFVLAKQHDGWRIAHVHESALVV